MELVSSYPGYVPDARLFNRKFCETQNYPITFVRKKEFLDYFVVFSENTHMTHKRGSSWETITFSITEIARKSTLFVHHP